jgi:hypothetical protein
VILLLEWVFALLLEGSRGWVRSIGKRYCRRRRPFAALGGVVRRFSVVAIVIYTITGSGKRTCEVRLTGNC